MAGFEEARRLILERVTRLGEETRPVLEAIGQVVATDHAAPWEMPAWDNSAMDGYAVRAADCADGRALEIAGFLPAGQVAMHPLEPERAIKIMTGAPVPPGADAILPFEHAIEEGGTVVAHVPPSPGDHIRHRGSDIARGDVVISAGTVLGPAEAAMLASFSVTSVNVFRRAKVAILSTGDELLEPGEPAAPGMIYNSNSTGLAAATIRAGAIPVVLPVARDDRESLREALVDGIRSDALVTSAGVSVGDRDLVREMLRDLGADEAFWKVDIQPGRPTTFATVGGTPVFSLPGNPVAALLTFELFVRPALRAMMGRGRPVDEPIRGRLAGSVNPRSDRVTLMRVRLERTNDGIVAISSGKQATGFLRTLVEADGVAIIPAASVPLPTATEVDIYPLRDEWPAVG